MKNNKKIIIIPVAIVALVILYQVFTFYKRASLPEQTACTMEALLCPDGSYVGRSGPSCSFATCPNQPSFVGILRQSSGRFSLEMASPAQGQEVAYTMPLIIKISNILGQIVGKKVIVFGTFSSDNTLNVDRLEESPDSDPTLGDVGVGQTVFINGVKITLNKIVQDSRCPIDVKCIEAGAINTNVTLQSNTDKETRNMSSDEVPVSFDSYKISIEKINPPRISKSEPLPASYVITFRVKLN